MKPADILAMLPAILDAIRRGRVSREHRDALVQVVESWARTAGARTEAIERVRAQRSERIRAPIRLAIMMVDADPFFSCLGTTQYEDQVQRRAHAIVRDRLAPGKSIPSPPAISTVRAVIAESQKSGATFSGVPCLTHRTTQFTT